jgi:glycerol uptake facilitator-like aquaporin
LLNARCDCWVGGGIVTLIPSARRVAAEYLGTMILVAAVVGSGIMATTLTDDVGVQLLMNMLATVLVLGLLIWTLGPISGAHFNPAVTGVAMVRREMRGREGAAYIPGQVAGAISGAILANLMFDLPAVQVSTTVRTGGNLLLGEVVATAGLLWIIGALTRTGNGRLGPVLVPAWIGAAYFFTSSTSFANPAVTIGRAFTDTFAGIAPSSVLPFIAAQLVGAAIGAAQTELFHPRPGRTPEPLDLPGPVHDRT